MLINIELWINTFYVCRPLNFFLGGMQVNLSSLTAVVLNYSWMPEPRLKNTVGLKQILQVL